jgi:hypothetical protein
MNNNTASYLGLLVWVVVSLMTISDMSGMKEFYSYYAWFYSLCMVLVGAPLLLSTISIPKHKLLELPDSFTYTSFVRHVIIVSVSTYLMYTLTLDSQMVVYITGLILTYSSFVLRGWKEL